MVYDLYIKKLIFISFIITLFFAGCATDTGNKSSASTGSLSSQNEPETASEVLPEKKPDDVVSSSSSQIVSDSIDENDYETYTQNIYEAVKAFDWNGYDGKVFLQNEQDSSYEYELYVTDLNKDSVADIILSRIYPSNEVSTNEIFTFVGNEIKSIGGFYGKISETEGTHSVENKSGSINLYKNKSGEKLFIQWVKSMPGDTNLVLCEVFVDTMVYNPVAGMHYNEQNQSYYGFNNEFPNSTKNFLTDDFWEIVQSISREDYDTVVAQCEQSLEKIGEIPYNYVMTYSLESPKESSSDIAEKICEEIEKFL